MANRATLKLPAVRRLGTHSQVTAFLLSQRANSIRDTAHMLAPSTRGSYRGQYKKNLEVDLRLNRRHGFRSFVLARRHAIVQEFGWTEWRDGIKHRGRYILTRALRAHEEE
ncbi:hypothetical protein SAMN05421505_112125 [Sinosporangium album]|uniref:Uncharacterized protein n=1 Tax=Sinosporangium album TaxID=504805 RepID=A0A1G8AEY6_9ACTN|nr:hypothetical protein SAMN05421505_112125 [Sinosporangium album]